MLNKNASPISLRKRYISLTAFFGVLVIGIALLMYLHVIDQRKQVSEKLQLIDGQADKVDALRDNVIVLHHAIDSYLLDPTSPGQQIIIKEKLDDSVHTIQQLQEVANKHQHLEVETRTLYAKFIQLRQILHELIEIRVDVQRQYPGMALSAFEMSGIQDQAQDYLQIMINEIESGSFTPKSRALYPLLLKTQNAWISLVSQMRIYLANRLASFSTDILKIQAASVDDISNVINKNLDQLQSIYANEEDSFEGSASVLGLRESLSEWMHLFEAVRAISESPEWRQDWNIMKTQVIPRAIAINQYLNEIDNHLRHEERVASEGLQRNTNHVFIILAAIITAVGILIITLIISLDLMVFKPILNIASALRLKAFGQNVPPFSQKQSEETQYLIDAFEEMDVQISQRQQALEYQSMHDSLTSLPNRSMLNQRLEFMVNNAQNKQSSFSLLILDLDNFKDINDAMGHQMGDTLLIDVAGRLKISIRDIDMLARLGGDEFAIILSDTPKETAVKSAEIISGKVTAPYTIDHKTITVGLSIGISCFPEDSNNAELLLQQADVAMYHAKRNKLDYAVYNPDEDEHNSRRLELIQDLHEALDKNQLDLHFQPQLNLESRRPVGAEALLRWQRPGHGFVRPDKLVALAEESGVINELTNCVLSMAIQACRTWHDAGFPIEISINLSVQNLNYPSLSKKVRGYLEQYGLEAKYVVLEITENGMMTNPGRSIEVLKELDELGIKISIDDFGTGFSSLSYLQRLPVHEVKIDKSFVINMDSNSNDRTIVESVIDLGHNLGLTVVAEGVETNKIMHTLKSLNCDLVQGYLISKPLPADQFLNWLQNNPAITSDLYSEEATH